MPITERENDHLTVLLQNLEPETKNMTERSRNFVRDQITRHGSYGSRIFMSDKQWKWLRDLHAEFCPEADLPDPNVPRDELPDTSDEGDDDDAMRRDDDMDDEIKF